MALRAQYDNVVLSEPEGEPMENVEVYVYDQGTTTPTTIYAVRTGGGTLTNPITTTTNGNVNFWAEPDSYDLKFHDTEIPARFSDRTITWEAISGDSSGGIDGVQIETDGIDANQINTDAVTTVKIKDDNVSRSKIAPGAVGRDEVQDGEILLAKLANDSVNANKIVDGSVGDAELAAYAAGIGKYALGVGSDSGSNPIQGLSVGTYNNITGLALGTTAAAGYYFVLIYIQSNPVGTATFQLRQDGVGVGQEYFAGGTGSSGWITTSWVAVVIGIKTLTLQGKIASGGTCSVNGPQTTLFAIRWA